ncbi:murein hydrolase activator EnvC family protein [Nocardioides aequoreus]|uniref:murein hydrolase activator EnvC family protein n=1 Tax=Nocardioides aequoreus TaxID=397278 RepID=UPI0004C2B60E|nr:M23 family metallopeptidase [Nocardioides aequoreus]
MLRRLLLLPILLLVLLLPRPAAGAEPAPSRDGAWPLQPRPQVVEGFDPPAVRWGSGHRGVDLAGWPGAPVHAALAGRVAFVGTVAGRGVVSVQHGALRTTYQPVTPSVAAGDTVARGQVIGHLALAGSHCFPGSCLHWGLKRGETYLDPLVLVGAGPVRLLPLRPLGLLGGVV